MPERHDRLTSVWLGLGCVAFSLAFACAAPFAGLGASAALLMGLRPMVAAVVLGWAANQAVGFGFLNYPVDGHSLAWGLALGLSALGAGLAAHAMRTVQPVALCAAAAFLAAFLAQQGTVFAASLILPSHPDAFAPEVIAGLFVTNLLGFAVLLGAVVIARGGWHLHRTAPRL